MSTGGAHLQEDSSVEEESQRTSSPYHSDGSTGHNRHNERNSTSAFTEPTHEIQFEHVLGPTTGFNNYPNPMRGFPMQTQLPNTQQTLQQGVLGFHHNSYEIEALSPRNVRERSLMQTQFSNIQQTLHCRESGFHSSTYEVGESSSRNIKMRMTIEEPQLSSSLYPTTQFNIDPNPARYTRHLIYDPAYAMEGLPLDPHLRALILRNEPW